MTLTISLSNDYSNNSINYSLNSTPCTNKGVCPKDLSNTSDTPDVTGESELTKEEKQQVKDLQNRDREVRAHEMAHVAGGGMHVRGGANFEYQTGPDGKRYAVGGEVSIDTAKKDNDPQATIQKMQIIKRAALAPAKPSPQDRSVAAQATQKEMEARQELREEQSAENKQNLSNKNMDAPVTASYTETGKAISFSSTLPTNRFNIIA
jgi:hypothetical protein